MNENTLGTLTALLTVIAFGISNTLWKKPLAFLSPTQTIAFRNIFTSMMLFIVWCFFPDKQQPSLMQYYEAIFISLVAYFGLYFLNMANKHGKLTIVTPIINCHPLVSVFTACFAIGEVLQPSQWYGLSFSFVGVLFLSSFRFKKMDGESNLPIYFAMLSALFFGVSFAFFGRESQQVGVARFAVLLEVVILILSTSQSFFIDKSPIVLSNFKKALPYILFMAVCGSIGVFFTNFTLYRIPVATTVIISDLGHLIPIMVGILYYKEKISKLQWLGVAFIILGVIVSKF
jgi:drug/metabolite transporter (DMT)-like permease